MTKQIKKHLLGTAAFSLLVFFVYMLLCLIDSMVGFGNHGVTFWGRIVEHSHYLIPALLIVFCGSLIIAIFNKMDEIK